MTINDFKKNLDRRISENDILNSQIQDLEKKILDNTRQLGCVKDALKIIEGLALDKRNGIKTGIETVVGEALKMLYGDEYGFEMSYSEKNNRSCLEMRVSKQTKDGVVKRMMDGFGGGVSDSISIPLRMMVLKGSNTGDILILDEAFKHVDSSMIEKVGDFLKTISEKLDMQIILVSHHKPLLKYAEIGFHLINEEGETLVEK